MRPRLPHVTGLGGVDRVTPRPELWVGQGLRLRRLAGSPTCLRAATGRGSRAPAAMGESGGRRKENTAFPRPPRGVSGSTKEALRRPSARPSGSVARRPPPSARARTASPWCVPLFPRAPSRVGSAVAGASSTLPALPPSTGLFRAEGAVWLLARAFSAEEAVRSFGRAPGAEVPPGEP